MKRTKPPQKVPVTARALIQRINRALKPRDEMLKKARGARAQAEVGDYFVTDFRLNALVSSRVDIEALGRELKVLKDFEEVTEH